MRLSTDRVTFTFKDDSAVLSQHRQHKHTRSQLNALTRVTTLDPAVKAVLAQRGIAVAVFKRGSRAAAAKGS